MQPESGPRQPEHHSRATAGVGLAADAAAMINGVDELFGTTVDGVLVAVLVAVADSFARGGGRLGSIAHGLSDDFERVIGGEVALAGV